MIGQIISHYRILKKLGEGGMGTVYLAEHTLLGRRAAIKFLKDIHTAAPDKQHLRARFLREAHALSTFSHPHIAAVYDYGETEEGQPYIIMEWVDGQTLSDLLRTGKQPLLHSLKLIEDIAEALAEAHRHGIIHRDIKPSNIAINERGQVKVLDFGLAKNISKATVSSAAASTAESQAPTQTRKGVVIGTPQYVSPEQALGQPLDARSDLFSLGAVLYECLTGGPAFSGFNEVEIYTKVVRDAPPLPSRINPEVPPKLDTLTLKCLAKSTDERYQSVEELLADLRDVHTTLDGGGYPRQRTTWHSWERLHDRVSRDWLAAARRRYYLVSCFLAALIVGIILWYSWPWSRGTFYRPPLEADRWFEEGIAALHDGTYYKASKILDEAVKIDDKFALAHARLAEAWMELGYTDKASSEIARANALILSDRSQLSRSDALYLQAINAAVTRNFNAAAESYREIVEVVQDHERPHVYVDLGLAYEKGEELGKAAESYQAATKLDSRYAAAFLRQGVLFGRQQNFTDAEAALDTAFRLYYIQTNPEGLTEVLYQRGILFSGKGDVVKARGELEHALNIVRTFSNLSQQVKTQLQLSSVYRLMGDTAQAKKHTIEAIDLARSNGLEDLTAQGLIELGNIFFFRSEIGEAKNYLKEGLDLARKYKLRVAEARALFLLGSLHIQQDEADVGEAFLRQSLPFYEQGKYRKEVMQSQTLLGQAYDLKGDYMQASAAFEQQLQLARQLNNRFQEALAHKGLGTVLTHQEKYTEALGHVEQSYAIYNDLKNELYAGYSLISRAELSWRLGYYDRAQAALSNASSQAEQPGGKFKQLWGRIYVVSAPMWLSRRKYTEAIRDAKRAIAEDDSKSKHPSIEVTPTLGLAQYHYGEESIGRQTCVEGVEMARSSDDPRLLANALLALAEIMLESNDAKGATVAAKEAQEIFALSGQADSEWRAWLIVGRASQMLGDNKAAREGLARADALLSTLQQRWGAEDFNAYLARHDIKLYRESLVRTSAALK